MRASGAIIVVSAMVAALSFWQRNTLPSTIDAVPQLFDEPRQTSTRARDFDVAYSGTNYRLEPEFAYELHGMVVSFRHHDGSSRMHRRAGDRLNMLDVCVIWGDNVRHPNLNRIDFWNGIFTCNVKTRDRAAWDAFDMRALSNNHLLSDSELVRDAVQKVRIGDQIRVRGLLTSYTGPGGTRGTSVTRDDTGDGACETIYVQEFAVVASANNPWRWSLYAALAILLVSTAIYWRSPYRPYASS